MEVLCYAQSRLRKIRLVPLSLSLSLQCTQGNCHITGLENCGAQKEKEKEKEKHVIRDKVRKQK